MKTKGKMKKLLCLLATVSMLVSLLPAAALAANDPALTATAMANGVQLSWRVADFAGATEYTLCRDDAPLATVNASNSNASVSEGTWTYNDVYFQTLEQMLGELSGADSADVSTNHTYSVKAGATTSATATAKPDTSKIAYFTFSNAKGFDDVIEINGGTTWDNVVDNGLQFNSPASGFATKNATASTVTIASGKTLSTLYSCDTTSSNRKMVYVDESDGKKAARLVAVKNNDSTAYASGFSLQLKSTYFNDATATNYTLWVNTALLGASNGWVANACFGCNDFNYGATAYITSGTTEIWPDNKKVNITTNSSYASNLTNSSFSYVVPSGTSNADSYATYKFKMDNVAFKYSGDNNADAGYKKLCFYAPSGTSNIQNDTTQLGCYNSDGEAAAIHSVAIIKEADLLTGDIEDEVSGPALTAASKANGVQLSWMGNDFGGAASFDVYRDNEKIATVDGTTVGSCDENDNYTYNDVYFDTLEQLLSEKGTAAATTDVSHTYYIAAGDVRSSSAEATADTSKLAYYTFTGEGTGKSISLTGYTSSVATRNTTAQQISSTTDYTNYTTLYTAPSGAQHRQFSYIGDINGKRAGALAAAKTGDSTVPLATGLKFEISSSFCSALDNSYTAWINASVVSAPNPMYIVNTTMGGFVQTGKFIPDKEDAGITYRYGANDDSYGFVNNESGAATYATYILANTKTKNDTTTTPNTGRTLTFYPDSSSDSSQGVKATNLKNYNTGGEQAAIHSVAVMKTADYLPPNEEVVDTVDAEAKLEAAKEALTIMRVNETSDIPLDTVGTNGTKISWSSNNTAAVGNDGKVYPKVGEAQSATLTATITLDGYSGSKTKTFTVNVPAVMDYAIDGVKLTKDGDSVIDTALVAGKTLKTISVRCYSESTTSLKAIIALYKGGTLVEVVSENVSAAGIAKYAYGDITLTTGLTLPDTIDDSYSVKIYLTNSKLTPLAMSYTVTPAPTAGITVYMAGDSTMQTYADKYFPLQGWGNELGSFLQTDAVTVDNTQSMGGRSTKYFIAEGRLNTIKQKIKAGDYLFVQFGHNDGKYNSQGDTEYYENSVKKKINIHTSIGSYQSVDAAKALDGDNTSYFAYLENFVDVAKNAGANVVLFTSFNRAYADENNLQGYPAAMRAFAAARNIPIVDTTDLSVKLYNAALTEGESEVTAGAVDSKENFAKNLFLYANANDPRYTSDSRYTSSEYNTQKRDSTHFNIYGAQARAKLAAAALCEAGTPLGRYVTVTAGTNDVIEDIITEIPKPYYGSTKNPAS